MPNPRILLVDDSEFFLQLEKGFLRETQATIFTASNGLAALEVATRSRPDLVFMDLNMPEMDGAECCARMKGDPELVSVPVIMVFALRNEKDLEACRNAGCDGWLTKPIDRKAFLDIGRRFLSRIERRTPRFPCQSMAVFRSATQSGYGTVLDLSRNGLYIGSSHPVSRGERLKFHFLLPGSSSRVVEGEARVAWVNRDHHRPKPGLPEGFGVEFVEVTEESARMLEAYIAAGKDENRGGGTEAHKIRTTI